MQSSVRAHTAYLLAAYLLGASLAAGVLLLLCSGYVAYAAAAPAGGPLRTTPAAGVPTHGVGLPAVRLFEAPQPDELVPDPPEGAAVLPLLSGAPQAAVWLAPASHRAYSVRWRLAVLHVQRN